MPAALTQTRAQTDDVERIALAGDGADQWRAVDCTGDRTVHHRLVHPEIRDLRGRMPCGHAGQLGAFTQNNIRPARLSQIVQRRTARNATPDNGGFVRVFTRWPAV